MIATQLEPFWAILSLYIVLITIHDCDIPHDRNEKSLRIIC